MVILIKKLNITMNTIRTDILIQHIVHASSSSVYQQKISDLIIKDKKKTIPDFLEGPRRQTDLTIMKNILRMLTIMIPLGCESATAIDKTNMIQSRVNICFTIEKSISSTAIDMKESYIGHYFLVYKEMKGQ